MEIDQTYEVIRIDGNHDPLREHPENPNKGDVDTIDESIEVNGWYGAVTAQKSTGYIIAGNHRYRTAKARGATEIPVIWKDVDDEAALRILLVDNQSARKAQMDEEKLTAVLESLESLSGTGYDEILHPLEEQIEAEREEEPLAIPPAGDPMVRPPSADGGPVPSVPADKYTPSWGIMVVCESEEDQEWVHGQISEILPGHRLQVVAV